MNCKEDFLHSVRLATRVLLVGSPIPINTISPIPLHDRSITSRQERFLKVILEVGRLIECRRLVLIHFTDGSTPVRALVEPVRVEDISLLGVNVVGVVDSFTDIAHRNSPETFHTRTFRVSVSTGREDVAHTTGKGRHVIIVASSLEGLERGLDGVLKRRKG